MSDTHRAASRDVPRLFVIGGRGFGGDDAVRLALSKLDFACLVAPQGTAFGASCARVAKEWPDVFFCQVLTMRVWWGDNAGRVRNRTMAHRAKRWHEAGATVRLLVFPGGKEVAHMLRMWRLAGLPTPMFVGEDGGV